MTKGMTTDETKGAMIAEADVVATEDAEADVAATEGAGADVAATEGAGEIGTSAKSIASRSPGRR